MANRCRKFGCGFFRTTLAILHTSAEETLHVGDSIAEDVEGARAAGFHAVLLDRSGLGESVPPHVATIVGLTQLPTLADALA